MNDAPVELWRGEFAISTDRARIDPDAALALLQTTHWGGGMERTALARAIENSISVTIAEAYRGQGLGRWLSESMLRHPEMQGLRRVALLTRDAEELYAQVGFTVGPGPLTYMEHFIR